MVLHIVRPVVPYIEYALNEEYIVQNICEKKDIPSNTCKGKCHLKKQLEKTVETDENSAPNTTKDTSKNSNKKNQNKEVKEFLNNYTKLPEIFKTDIEIFEYAITFPDSGFVSKHFIPPDKI